MHFSSLHVVWFKIVNNHLAWLPLKINHCIRWQLLAKHCILERSTQTLRTYIVKEKMSLVEHAARSIPPWVLLKKYQEYVLQTLSKCLQILSEGGSQVQNGLSNIGQVSRWRCETGICSNCLFLYFLLVRRHTYSENGPTTSGVTTFHSLGISLPFYEKWVSLTAPKSIICHRLWRKSALVSCLFFTDGGGLLPFILIDIQRN